MSVSCTLAGWLCEPAKYYSFDIRIRILRGPVGVEAESHSTGEWNCYDKDF
jgi:hypothetical protein